MLVKWTHAVPRNISRELGHCSDYSTSDNVTTDHIDIYPFQLIFFKLESFHCNMMIITGEFPAQKPVMRNFDVYFELRPNKRLSKQSWDWWFETPWHPLWHHCNECIHVVYSDHPKPATFYMGHKFSFWYYRCVDDILLFRVKLFNNVTFFG